MRSLALLLLLASVLATAAWLFGRRPAPEDYLAPVGGAAEPQTLSRIGEEEPHKRKKEAKPEDDSDETYKRSESVERVSPDVTKEEKIQAVQVLTRDDLGIHDAAELDELIKTLQQDIEEHQQAILDAKDLAVEQKMRSGDYEVMHPDTPSARVPNRLVSAKRIREDGTMIHIMIQRGEFPDFDAMLEKRETLKRRLKTESRRFVEERAR